MTDEPEAQHHPRVMHDLTMAEIHNRDQFLAWLRGLPALQRARMARALADAETVREIGKIGDGAVFELTRDASWAEVAEQLGVGKAAINKAIARHNGIARPREYPRE